MSDAEAEQAAEGQGLDTVSEGGPANIDIIESLDTTKWHLTGPDIEGLRIELKEHLMKASIRESDLYRLQS